MTSGNMPMWVPWPERLVRALLALPGAPAPLPLPASEALAPEVTEAGPELVLRVPLSGIDPASLEVRLDGRALHLSGTGRQEYREERAGEVFTAAAWQGFRTVLPLPVPVDPAGAQATLRDGVLEVRAHKLAAPT